MTPAAYAVLNLSALRHNLDMVRRTVPNAKVMAVIKANAYGHGLLRTASALQTADALAVARVDEGIKLRQAGLSNRITVLEGFSCAEELHELLRYGFEAVIHCPEQIALLDQLPDTATLSIWLKLDTGMNRLGFRAAELPVVYARLRLCPAVDGPIKWMTHLANADDLRDDKTVRQIELFNEAVMPYDGERSIANSAGILAWPEARADWVRPDLMLFGVSPLPGKTGRELGLEPVMSLHSRLIAIKRVEQGESVGYGNAWIANRPTKLGVVAIGYGDGYPRHIANGAPVLVKQQRVPLVGRVSMDMLTVDVSDCPDAHVGDPVTLWGEQLPVEEIAHYAGTIPYTLLCGITQRVQILEHGES